VNSAADIQDRCSGVCVIWPANLRARLELRWGAHLNVRLVQIEADGDAIARMAAVVEIISITVVVHVNGVAIVPIT